MDRPTIRRAPSAYVDRPAQRVDLAGGAVASPAGPLALDSREARAAIDRTLTHLAATRLTLGSSDTSKDFTPRSVERDALGMTHVRLDRLFEGVKVFGEQVIGHLDRSGTVKDVTGELPAIPRGLFSAPLALSADDALAAASTAFGGATDKARPPQVERVIYRTGDGQYRAAYHVKLENVSDLSSGDTPRRMNYLVDAADGTMLTQFDQLGGFAGVVARRAQQTLAPPDRATAPAASAANDTSLYSGKVDLATTRSARSYRLEDAERGVVTYDAKNKPTASGKTHFTDANDVWGEAKDAARTRAAIDAHYGAMMTHDFLGEVLGRSSIDGKGERLVSYVHVDKNMVNAYWDGEKMNYGDGDGRDAGPLTTLDIAGHEIAHGLTERTAGLVYDGESGGLNEAMSDIIGCGVEWYASKKNSAVKFDWTVGEDAWTPKNGDATDGLRYMDDPTRDGYSIDNYKDYPKQTEVHGSSGIANNAFYLLVNGGTNRTSGLSVKAGIGMEKGQQIFYRALSVYMTPRTTFAQAREATVKAATDLFGARSAEVSRVKDAWTAVGVK